MDVESRGQRIARARKRRGWTQQQLAAALDRSASWVSQVERGALPLDRMSVLDQLASTLGVEIVELTGQPYRHDRPGLDSGHAGIPDLRLALQRAKLPRYVLSDDGVPRLADDLQADVEHVEHLRQAADFAALGGFLPRLLNEVVAARKVGDGAANDRLDLLLVRVGHVARVTADLTGHHDLAWMAVELELATAERSGSPAALAAAAWDLCGVWLHASALAEARDAAEMAIGRLQQYIGRDEELTALTGALHLRAAVAYSRMWSESEVRDHLAEAARLAPDRGNAWQTQYNRTNVAIHALETAVELGRPTDALGLSDEVAIDAIESRERQTHFWTCRARGLGMNGHNRASLDALLRAERVAPAHVHNRPMARELVADLLHRDRRGDAHLRALARRMGIA
jgi:transcriptional regulator with XRE-family HTH domain